MFYLYVCSSWQVDIAQRQIFFFQFYCKLYSDCSKDEMSQYIATLHVHYTRQDNANRKLFDFRVAQLCESKTPPDDLSDCQSKWQFLVLPFPNTFRFPFIEDIHKVYFCTEKHLF